MKKHLLKFLLTFFIALFINAGWVNGQTSIWTEDFTSGTYTVTLGAEGNDGTADYFQTTDGSNIGITYTGQTGNFFAAQDIDDSGWLNSASPSQLTWSSINIAGYSSLEFSGLFASNSTSGIDDSDYAIIEYQIDGGGWNNLLAFENDGTQYNTFLLEDADFDGTGDGTQLTATFATFTKSIGSTGSSLDLRITIAMNSGGEDIAIEDFEIIGTQANPNDNTSLADATGVTQPSTANIASTIDEQSEAVAVFQFNIADDGAADGLPTEVTAITIKGGPNNTADWTSDINGGYLVKEGTGPLTITTEPNVQADQVTFYIDDTELDIPDGGSQLVTLYVWLNTTVTDNAVIQCMIDADDHGFISDIAGSGFASDFGTDVTGNDFTIDVTSTQLSFITQPSNAIIAVAMDPAVEVAAIDANGNIDVDYTSNITLTYSGSGNMTGTNPVAAVSGVATFSDLAFDTEESNVTLAANDGSFAEATSNSFGVYTVTTVTPPYIRDFETGDINTDGWTTQLVTGTLDWDLASFGGDTYAQMSNYDGSNHASETWLISPAIDLSSATTAIFGFYNACKDFAGTSDDIEVYISANYDGSSAPSTATWDQLSPTLSPGDYDDVYSGDIDISSYVGGSIYIAFKYIGTDSDGKTWQIDDISIITDPPVISNFATTPASPTASDAVTISADINDNGSIASASLSWGLSTGDYSEGTITMSEGTAPNYVADGTIAAQAEETTVYYVISATDNDGLTTTSDEQTYYIPRTDAHITSGVYTVVDGTPGTISNIAHGTDLATFKSNITAPPGGSFEVYESDGGAVASDLQDGYFLTGIAEDGTTEADYNIEVSDVVPDTDSDVSAPTTQVPATTVAVVDGDETAEAFEVFSFDINDAGTADGLPTYVRQIVLFYGPNMTLDPDTEIADGWFEINSTKVDFSAEPVAGIDSIAFTFAEGVITVPDGGSVNAVLKIVIDPNTADGKVFQAMIDADQHGFETVGISSEFATTFTGDITGNNITIDVIATELNFSTEPTNVYVDANINPSVVVEAIDANGNVDTDYVTDVTITATGATLTSAVSGTPDAGIATFDAISFSDAGNGVTLTAASGTLTNGTSTTFDVRIEPEKDLFISEYIEGSSSNKAIEIYNPNNVPVDLSEYTIKQSHNGTGWGVDGIAYILPLEGILEGGEVYVVANADANAAIIAVADTTFSYSDLEGHKVPSFNGDDAMGLFKNDVLIDVIGVPDEDPAAGGWDVADTIAATGEHTIMRKFEIDAGNTDWAASAGTNFDNSEWIVFGQDFFANIGLVSFQAPSISDVTIDPTAPTSADNVTVSATITDGDTETANLTVSLMHGTTEGSEDTEVTFNETATADVFEGTIPASSSTVYYKVTASDEYITVKQTGTYSITTGIGNPDGIVSMNIYPNPSNGLFTLEMNTAKAGTFNVEIINISGQVVYTKQINQDGFYQDQINISNKAKGIYYIRIMDGNQAKVSKIMIQ